MRLRPRRPRLTSDCPNRLRRRVLIYWPNSRILTARAQSKSPLHPCRWRLSRSTNQHVRPVGCARFCPTGALRFDVEDDQFGLVFQAAVCVDCAICALACPEHAIRFGDRLRPSALAAGYAEALTAGALARCGECGAPIAHKVSNDGDARCYSCRHGAGIVRSLRDEAGLMDDLLSRI